MADTEGFEEFYTATVGRLLGQLYPVTGDLHEAEELVQEAYARASTRWARLRDYDLPEAWVRALPMHQRQAIVLHHLVDLPLEEVAATLGARTGTVKSWLARGRRALADRLGEPEEVLS
ncbi:MAG TPA: sigma factor-like helix-turn-helix DNA-binding protein [Actinomycetota bacterium]|nr:sigma factor-like helix-turn-helix DNA-binding protein [Actinomycetota bacterium]